MATTFPVHRAVHNEPERSAQRGIGIKIEMDNEKEVIEE